MRSSDGILFSRSKCTFLITRRDASLSTIFFRSSCLQSDRDATTFSCVVLSGSRMKFHMPGHKFLGHYKRSCASPTLSCGEIPCLLQYSATSELLVRQCIRSSTASFTLSFVSQSWTCLLSLIHETFCDARRSALLDHIFPQFLVKPIPPE